jgi:hypothetical protein
MRTTEMEAATRSASASVLETMFFADALPAPDVNAVHTDPVSCQLHCTGAEDGIFSIAVDRTALLALCSAFYGDDELTLIREQELACELTNMLAGSTLSVLAPTRACELSAPRLCKVERHLETGTVKDPSRNHSFVALAVEGGLLTVSCSLRSAR